MSGPAPRPQLVTAAEFQRLCQLAWSDQPDYNLAKQTADALQVAEFTVRRWFKGQTTPPPAVVAQALDLADKRLSECADLLDRVAQAIKQTPGT